MPRTKQNHRKESIATSDLYTMLQLKQYRIDFWCFASASHWWISLVGLYICPTWTQFAGLRFLLLSRECERSCKYAQESTCLWVYVYGEIAHMQSPTKKIHHCDADVYDRLCLWRHMLLFRLIKICLVLMPPSQTVRLSSNKIKFVYSFQVTM